MAERTLEKLMDVVADGAWQVLHHYVCWGYKTSQRGSNVGVIHTRHNAYQLYPVHPLKENTCEQQQAEERKKKPCVSFKMVSPAQATLEQAESELKEPDTVSLLQSQSRHQSVNTHDKIKKEKRKKKKKSKGTIFA